MANRSLHKYQNQEPKTTNVIISQPPQESRSSVKCKVDRCPERDPPVRLGENIRRLNLESQVRLQARRLARRASGGGRAAPLASFFAKA